MKSFVKIAAAFLLTAGIVSLVSLESRAGGVVAKPVSSHGSSWSGSAEGHYGAASPVYEGDAFASPGWIDEGAGHGAFGPPGVEIGAGPRAAGPPPGTVGMTYRRASRHIPDDRHPRTAMLTVAAPGATAMAVEGMKCYQDANCHWHFETKEPLLPGIPHIYHVKARLGPDPDAPVEFRTVRLIPGRILDLDW